MIFLSTLLLSLCITVSLIPYFTHIAKKMKIFDVPDERKVHTGPIPRVGGLAIAIGVFVAVFLWKDESGFLKAYIIGSAVIVFFGIIDDIKGLNYKVKFACQIIAALVIVFYGGLKIANLGMLLPDNVLLPGWIAVPFTIVLIVGVTNAINLADGLDGLAGGICLLSFCCIGYLAFLEENTIITLISISLVGAIFGFLRFNTYPATLFMGDTGSQFLGFSLVTVSVALTQGTTALSPLLPVLIFGFPVLDTVVVMAQRLAEGNSPFLPDKKHFHHRLLRLGLYHTEAVFIIYILQAVLVTSAFIFRFYSEWVLLIGYVLFSILVIGSFLIADISGYSLKRYDIIDNVIKGKLRVLKERGLIIIVSFKIVEYGIPLLVILTCFVPREIPGFISLISTAFVVMLITIWFLKKRWLYVSLTLILYLLVPPVIYLSTIDSRIQDSPYYLSLLYNFTFVFLVFFVIMTLKFTRRKRGFKVTPMDFLIFFIALAAPYIAGMYTTHKGIGVVAAKTIMFFFSYEVLMGELRGHFDKLTFTTICILIVIAARGLLSA